nr:MAG TPA: hypothetical protein [Caudoviricetes sp.]
MTNDLDTSCNGSGCEKTHGYRVASISKYSRVRGVGYSIT